MKSSPYLMSDQTIFCNSGVFEFDYVPEQLAYRDTQLRELAYQARPGVQGHRPFNTIIRGLPGTGKTTCVKTLFSEIEDCTTRLMPVYVNCQHKRTTFAVFSAVYQKLSGQEPPATGASLNRLLDAVAYLVKKNECVLLVCLDDANYLVYENAFNDLLYVLLRMYESDENVRTGVIAVSSDMSLDLRGAVDPRVFSVFHPTEVYFPPYSQDEMETILTERVQQAFYPGVVPPEVPALAAELAHECGDLRVGIDLLLQAGRNVEMDARNRMTLEDVERAYEVSRFVHLRYAVAALKQDERRVLQVIAGCSEDDDEEGMSVSAVFKAVSGSMKCGYSKFHRCLEMLDTVRLVDVTHVREKGGRKVVTLRYEPERVREVCG